MHKLRSPYLQTRNCVVCGHRATLWTGHTKHPDGTKIIAGWCINCESYIRNYLNASGYYGEWKMDNELMCSECTEYDSNGYCFCWINEMFLKFV